MFLIYINVYILFFILKIIKLGVIMSISITKKFSEAFNIETVSINVDSVNKSVSKQGTVEFVEGFLKESEKSDYKQDSDKK